MAQSTSQANSHLARFLPSKGPIQADFVTCLAPVIAEPGDRLIVLNGFCIGVDTGGSRQEAHHPAPLPLKLLPSPKPKLKSKPRGGDHRSATITTIVQERKNVVIKVLAERGPLRAAALCKAANIRKSELTVAVNHLDAEHLLVIPQVRGTGHKRLYQLRKATP